MNKTGEDTLEKLVATQVKKWETETKRRYKKPIRPVLTISKLPGSGAETLAGKLSEDLKLDLFDHEIIEEIAKSAQISKSVIDSLDEEDRNFMDDWLSILEKKFNLRPDTYLLHLTHVIASIGTHGHAVIVGRGAGFILPTDVSLRLLIVAPKDVRINNVKEAYHLTDKEAEKKLMEADKERGAFINKYFDADLTDPTQYDLTINTANVTVDVAVDIVKEVFNRRQWYDYLIKK